MDVYPEFKVQNNLRNCKQYGSCYKNRINAISPNGEWATFLITDLSNGLAIVRIDNSKRWNIYYHDLVPSKPISGEEYVNIDHWSMDGKFLYLNYSDGSEGGFFPFWNEYDRLYRLDLNTGEWEDTKMGSAHAFSPNDKYLTYKRDQVLVVFEFQTGEEWTIKIPNQYKAFGKIKWSPDSSMFLFISAENNFMEAELPHGFNLVLVDIENKTTSTILENDERFLFPAEWISDQQALLCIFPDSYIIDLVNLDSNIFLLDLQTLEISEYGTANEPSECY